MQTFCYILAMVGLVLDAIGFIGIYFIKIKGISGIDNFRIRVSSTWGGSNQTETEINVLRSEINDVIKKWNKEKDENDKRAEKYFTMLVLGFIFQFLSSFIGMVNPSSSQNITTYKCCCKNHSSGN